MKEALSIPQPAGSAALAGHRRLVGLLRWLFCARPSWQVVLLLVLPWCLVLFDFNLLFPTLIHDPWIYLGYAIDPWRMLEKYRTMYFSSRLAMIVPLAAAHRLLPPLTAHLAMRWLLYEICVLCVYDLVCRTVGRRSGLIAALFTGTYFFFLEAIARDYSDAFGITYLFLSMWATSRVGPRTSGKLAMALAGACSVALVSVNLVYLILAPVPLVQYAATQPRKRGIGGVATDLALFCFGAAALFIALCGLFHAATGRYGFLDPSIEFARSSLSSTSPLLVNGRSVFKFKDTDWVASAVWLGLPIAVAAGSVPAAFRAVARRGGPHAKPGRLWAVLYLGQFLFFLALDVLTPTGAYLQVWYYASSLIPLLVLALGSIFGKGVEPLDARAYAVCAVAATVLFLAQVSTALKYVYPHRSMVAPLLTVLVPALAAIFLLRLGRGSVAVISALVLLSGSMYACRWGFSEEKSVPIFGMQHTSDMFKPTPGAPTLLPYVQRMHQYDHYRADAFLSIVDSVRYIKTWDTRNDVIFWFDMLDPHAMVYDNLACTRCWGYSVLNFNFPNVAEARAFDRHEFGIGQLIAIPSVRADAYDYAKLGLAGIGFDARLVDRREIAHGAIKFTITLVELETRKEYRRTDSRETAAARDGSWAPLTAALGAADHAANDRASCLHGLVPD